MTLWRIRKGEQLCDSRGVLVAGSGELVAADHPALLAHPDPTRIACREVELVDVPPAAPSDADPGDEAPVVLDPVKLASFGKPPQSTKRSGKG